MAMTELERKRGVGGGKGRSETGFVCDDDFPNKKLTKNEAFVS